LLDKFYTNVDVAIKLIKIADDKIGMNNYTIIEPSAGDGSFSNYLLDNFDDVLAYDIKPENKSIIKKDYFTFKADENKKYVVIGNPPFGHISSLAYKFLDYSMNYADYVCFLIPRTFKRYSILKKINKNFHLIHQEDLPIGVFIPSSMMAKTVFQIWEKRDYLRIIPVLNDISNDFTVLSIENRLSADFAVRAYGSNCGEIKFNIPDLAPKSWHFIKSNIEINLLIHYIKKIDFSFSKDTVRQDSVGKKELIHYYNILNPPSKGLN